MIHRLFLILLFIGIFSVKGQYPFIKIDQNEIGNLIGMEHFFSALDSLSIGNKKKVQIVHIGDSHLQADYYSGSVRSSLQTTFGNGGRGFVFPYKLAQTNQPESYKIYSTGTWGRCRSVKPQPGCHLGLSGLCVYTSDPLASLGFDFSKSAMDFLYYTADSIVLFQESNLNTTSGIPQLHAQTMTQQSGLFTFDIPKPITDSISPNWDFYGALVYQNSPGIVYHSLGLNGADISSYLRCDLLPYQLPYLDADLVILSLGTNDAYMSPFDSSTFSQTLESFLGMIRAACPKASILLVTPADSYRRYRRRIYDNLDMAKAGWVLKNQAISQNLAYWDFYQVMGGKGSMGKWKLNRLAQPDYVHFTPAGYQLQGRLLFDALMKAYENRKP